MREAKVACYILVKRKTKEIIKRLPLSQATNHITVE